MFGAAQSGLGISGLLTVWVDSVEVCRFDLLHRFFENAQPVERSVHRIHIVKNEADVLVGIEDCNMAFVRCEVWTLSATAPATASL